MYHASHFLRNAVQQDLVSREKKQYSVLEKRLSDNNIVRLNPKKKIFVKLKGTENTQFKPQTEKSYGQHAVSTPNS